MQPSLQQQQQLSGKARRQHSAGTGIVQHQCAAAALCRPPGAQPVQRHLANPPPASSNAAGKRAVRCAAAIEDRMDKLRKESAQVEDRVATVLDLKELKQHLAKAGTKLVVLELQGEGVCEAGFDDPEPELHWKLDQESAFRKRMAACQAVKSRFQRTARDCPDVDFLAMQVSDDAEGEALKEQLGVSILPAVVFFKQGELLWHQEGYSGLENEIAEGVLYYDGQAAGGVKASQFVTELSSKRHMEDFVREQHSQMLTVVNVSTSLCTPCVRVYPAVLALAQNFVGQAAFARLLADEVDNPERLMADLKILEVPAFLFFRGGVEVGRHVGSSRGDLIGQILKLQLDAGIRPPPPPPGSGRGAARAKASAAKRKVTSRW